MSSIAPSHVSLYLWTVTQTLETLDITFDLPSDVSPHDLVFNVPPNDPRTIFCSLGSEVPFLAGTLFSSASKTEFRISDTTLTLLIFKSEPAEWDQLIVEPMPDLTIDPCSAFQLALYAFAGTRVHRTDARTFAPHFRLYIGAALAVNFPPALTFRARQLLQEGNVDSLHEAELLLERAVVDYGYKNDAYLLGVVYFRSRKFKEAEKLFQAQAVRGDDMCANCLGELYSPIEGEVTGLEDSRKAVEVFQKIIERNSEHPFALYNMAKLYLAGCGVAKNVARAAEMYRKARVLDRRVPVIEFCEGGENEVVETPSVGFWLAVIIPVVIVGVFIGVKFMRSRRKP
jgi:hypothetical protein